MSNEKSDPLAVGQTGQTSLSQSQAVSKVSPSGEFTNISLSEPSSDVRKGKQKKKKVPRRVLHFNDGILEEYSTDEEEEPQSTTPAVNPKSLKWMPWVWYYVSTMAAATLSKADVCGEKLAWFFGITSPKYQYAIDEHNRIKAEDERERMEDEQIAISLQEIQSQSVCRTETETSNNVDNAPEVVIKDTKAVTVDHENVSLNSSAPDFKRY